MVDLRINETRQTGAVTNRTYRVELNAVRNRTYRVELNAVRKPQLPGGESVYLFSEFTIYEPITLGISWHHLLLDNAGRVKGEVAAPRR